MRSIQFMPLLLMLELKECEKCIGKCFALPPVLQRGGNHTTCNRERSTYEH